MENIHYIFIAGLVVSLISTAGLLVVKTHAGISRFINNNLTILTSISAGIFLVTSFMLIRETTELLQPLYAGLSFLLGFLLYFVMYHVIKPHRHMGEDHTHDAKQSAYRVLFGDTLHNIADGLLLVASFGASAAVGFSNTVSIVLHELPQELSEFFVLKKSGYSDNAAIYRNFATALSVFIGIALGLLLIRTETVQAYLMGATATFFLGIVFMDLFPVKKLYQDKELVRNSLAVLLGVVIMSTITTSLGHSHELDHDHAHIDDAEHTYDHDTVHIYDERDEHADDHL